MALKLPRASALARQISRNRSQLSAQVHCRAISSGPLRSTLSTTWAPTGGIAANEDESGHGKLVRAGFLRQAHSGIFQYLPLGLRVQDKLEKLLDKHMASVGASRLSLSTISSTELWERSNRLHLVAPELFRLTDRKDVPLILSPTHEEEITTLVAATLKSYKDLPIRLYQITRKYRDERRPRHGLLRSREFLMKDMYTFDLTVEAAIETYQEVSKAYRAFFAELKTPLLVAEASSGDMGGELSHEYLLPNPIGEDKVVTCKSCGYTANDEVATARTPKAGNSPETLKASQVNIWRGISKDRKVLINAWYPQVQEPEAGENDVNIHAVKLAVPDLDTTIDKYLPFWTDVLNDGKAQVLNIIDARIAPVFDSLQDQLPLLPKGLEAHDAEHLFMKETESGVGLNLMSLADGDGCPRCDTGKLKIHKALELGHTFHLGTRYSKPLDACVTLPSGGTTGEVAEAMPGNRVPVQMGCHGVGLSRILGAVAEHLADEKGLNWPRAIAPFEVAIIPTPGLGEEAANVYDKLAARDELGNSIDVVLDDRKQSFGWRMKDADLVGYPVVVVLGKSWKQSGTCEVQCRRLAVKENVPLEALPKFVSQLLDQL